MKTKVNLNNAAGTYSSCLTAGINDIYANYENKTVSAADFKSFLLSLVNAANDTDAKRKFVLKLNQKTNKDDMLMFVSNVTLRADHMSSNIYDKWSNEK